MRGGRTGLRLAREAVATRMMLPRINDGHTPLTYILSYCGIIIISVNIQSSISSFDPKLVHVEPETARKEMVNW